MATSRYAMSRCLCWVSASKMSGTAPQEVDQAGEKNQPKVGHAREKRRSRPRPS
jgi:hypothetical protein